MSEVQSSPKQSRAWWITLGSSFLLFVLLGVLFYKGVDPKVFHHWATHLSGGLVFLLLALLPLVGFPVSILFVVAGAKFGSGWGLAIVGASILFHLLSSYYLASTFLHDWITTLLKRTKYRLPKIPADDCIAVTLLTALVPGVPYTAKNYLLVLAGVPFRIYLLTCFPAHLFHASLAIFFGDLTRDLTRGRLIFLGSYAVVVILLGRHVIKRLRTRKKSEAS